MKKFTLALMAICIITGALAQSKYAKLPVQSIPAQAIKNQITPAQTVNPLTNSKSALEDILGTTFYDMQTNGTMDNRITTYPDASMAGVWIRGTANSAERGTGYNYYNGTAWQPAPTARIENDRTGWPSYAPLGATGEIVIAHLNDGLKISTRAVK